MLVEKINKLKLGDIRKFKLYHGDIVGVIIGMSPDRLQVVGVEGVIQEIHKRQIQDVTATRLDKHTRERFEGIGSLTKEKTQLRKEFKKLEIREQEINKKINKQREYMRKDIGIMDASTFAYKLEEAFRKKSTRFKEGGYRVDIMQGVGLLTIVISRTEDIVKYPDENDFSFLMREYDGNLMFWEDYEEDRQYKELIKKHQKKDIILKGKGIEDSKTLLIGDKHLCYAHQIDINCVNRQLNKELLKELVALI